MLFSLEKDTSRSNQYSKLNEYIKLEKKNLYKKLNIMSSKWTRLSCLYTFLSVSVAILSESSFELSKTSPLDSRFPDSMYFS